MTEQRERIAKWLAFVMPPINRAERKAWVSLSEETKSEYLQLADGVLREIGEDAVIVERSVLVGLLEFVAGHAIEYGHELGIADTTDNQHPRLWQLVEGVQSGDRATLSAADWPGELGR